MGDLVRGIIAAGRGEIALPPDVATGALTALARGEAGSGGLLEPLSERERDVLYLLAQGMTNKDIAHSLMLSVRTVEAHLRSVFDKLGVRSRTEAALWAVKRGFGGITWREFRSELAVDAGMLRTAHTRPSFGTARAYMLAESYPGMRGRSTYLCEKAR